MKQFWLGVVAMAVTSACSDGPPFGGVVTDGEVPVDPTIPTDIAGDLDGFTYNAATQSLTIVGVRLDETPAPASYRRGGRTGVINTTLPDITNPRSGELAYEAYSAQDSSLDRHATAYVRERDGVRGVVVLTGGQFGSVLGGAGYSRSGSYDPPTVTATSGLVSYAGRYIGLLNTRGDGNDLLPVAAGTDPAIQPGQAAEVVGDILINADFADSAVNGRIYNRVVPDLPGVLDPAAGDDIIDLDPTAITTDGTFVGDATQRNENRGTYAGIFGGQDSSAVAGAIYVEGHISTAQEPLEYGTFVLSQCGTPNADPTCNQPNP